METSERTTIKNWLARGKYRTRECPQGYGDWSCSDCRDVFPRCRSSHPFNCPCHLYTHTYVIRKARQIVKGDTR